MVDLVTHILDIENVGDQIDLLRRHALDPGGLGPNSRPRPPDPVDGPNPSPRPARTRFKSLPT